tara:strand:- start:2006 stop:2536 length:531 start_codon:yes stop_codon:yes gene_type:complete
VTIQSRLGVIIQHDYTLEFLDKSRCYDSNNNYFYGIARTDGRNYYSMSHIKINKDIPYDVSVSTMLHEYFHTKYHYGMEIYSDDDAWSKYRMELEANLFEGICMMEMPKQNLSMSEKLLDLITERVIYNSIASYKCRFDVIAMGANRILDEMGIKSEITEDDVEALYLLLMEKKKN